MLYLLLIIITTFSKELIVINPEFVVIVGFLTIFFILKSLLFGPIVDSLQTYSQKIKSDYLMKINTEIFAFDRLIASVEAKMQYINDLENYYIFLENRLINFIETAKKNLIFRSKLLVVKTFLKHFSITDKLFKHVRKYKKANMKKAKKKNILLK